MAEIFGKLCIFVSQWKVLNKQQQAGLARGECSVTLNSAALHCRLLGLWEGEFKHNSAGNGWWRWLHCEGLSEAFLSLNSQYLMWENKFVHQIRHFCGGDCTVPLSVAPPKSILCSVALIEPPELSTDVSFKNWNVVYLTKCLSSWRKTEICIVIII